MLKEFLDGVVDLGRRATAISEVDAISAADGVYLDIGGELVFQSFRRIARAHTALTLASFFDAAQSWSDSTIWVGKNGIRCVRDAIATEERGRHPVFDEIKHDWLWNPLIDDRGELDEPEWRDQISMVEMLRHDFSAVQFDPDGFPSIVRQLKFSTSMDAAGDVAAHSAAMGKTVQAQIMGSENLPEDVTVKLLALPSTPELGTAKTLKCSLFSRPDRGELKLAPVPGALDLLFVSALRDAADMARSVTEHPVFVGDF
jgi:hypothetical protein